MVCLSPWAFGGAEPFSEFLLDAGLAALVGLWGLRLLVEGQLSWKKCPLALCLAGLFVTGIWQLAPLPKPVLSALSPATARLYDQLLPSQPEILPFGETHEAVQPRPGSTISVYPATTRRELIRLLAVLLLFAVVRNNIASPAALKRLSIAALLNGCLLSLFAVVQFFTSPRHMLYWTWPSQGQVFGPFICRNHFPFYVNMCLGLGAGLLLHSRYRGMNDWRRRTTPRGGVSWTQKPANLLHDPAALWVSVALALMLSGIALSLSRGGILALAGASLVCLVVYFVRFGYSGRLGTVVLTAAMALGLLTWFGFDYVQKRLEGVWQGTALEESRLPLWSACWPLFQDFPLWGTGAGTFQYVEPLHRTRIVDSDIIVDHVHNEYLEALVEGGLVRLGLSLAGVGCVIWLGLRAVLRQKNNAAAGLALGALFAFLTMVIHSIGDFGLHLPAIAVLTAVLSAQLAASGSREAVKATDSKEAGGDSGEYRLRLLGLAPVLGAATLFGLGGVVLLEGHRSARAEGLRKAALWLATNSRADSRERVIDYLEAAARVAPEYARLQAEAGQAHLNTFEQQLEKSAFTARLCQAAQAVLVPVQGAVAAPVPSGLSAFFAVGTFGQQELKKEEECQLRTHGVKGLRHYLRARDLCPLMNRPHLRLAVCRNWLVAGDEPGVYLDRAKLVLASDPEVWFFCGDQELRHGERDKAMQSWRQCLELSDRYLSRILADPRLPPSPDELSRRLLPDKPEILAIAAFELFPSPEAAEKRRPLLEKALALLDNLPRALTPEELHLKGHIHRALNQGPAAVTAFRAALLEKPQNLRWRQDLAALLYHHKQWTEARRELRIILDQRPGDAEAQRLLDAVQRQIAEGK
jgi:O-antigen ligase